MAVSRVRTSRRQERGTHARFAAAAHLEGTALRVVRARGATPAALWRRRDVRPARRRAAFASPRRSTGTSRRRPRRGSRPPRWCRTEPTLPRQPRRSRCPTSVDAQSAGPERLERALSALDYETGEIIAYVGSANYYERRKVSKKMQPQFDVLSGGWRQPGSAFKPFTYATGIDEQSLTAATMLMDVTTDFGGYTPTDFNGRERGPLRVRNALQFSLNVPAVKALSLVGENGRLRKSEEFGMDFQTQPAHGRPLDGPGHARGASARPQPGVRHHGQRRAQRRPHIDPQGHVTTRAPSTSTRHPRARRSSSSRRPTS